MKRLLQHPIAQAALAKASGLYLAFALRTTRWSLEGDAHMAPHAAGAPVVVAFWHERLPLMPMLWVKARQSPEGRNTHNRVHVLVSQHRDGRFIGAVVSRFALNVVLGSSSRGGAKGLRAMLNLLAGGDHIAITPDGPRGPRRVAAPGVAQLAAMAGVPVLPCAAQTTRRRILPTWDGMVAPLPFGRGVVVCLPTITVDREAWQDAVPAIGAALTAAAERADQLAMPRLSALGATWAAAATVASPGLRLMLRIRQARGKELPGRLRERRGIDPTPRPPGRLIWLHAASVGETVSILPVLPALAEHATVLLTTGTVTSARLLAQRLDANLARQVIHRFVPLDVPAWARRFLDHWRPDAAGFVESELWPNLLAACRTRRIPVMLINARLSARSQARWQRGRALARQMLSGLALVQPRSATDAQRLRALGCRNMTEPADLKLAAPPLPVDEAELARLRTLLAGRAIWLAASTHPGEDELVIAVHSLLVSTHPGLLTIIAPRHPERGEEISQNHLRSRGEPPPAEGVWIADTLGELGLWYRLAPIVFVGRSLIAPGGGQNPLEPARLGCAVAVGPHTGNFTDHVATLHAAGALTVVRDADQLARWVDELLRDASRRQAIGDAGRAIVQRHSDLPERTAAALLGLSPSPCGLGPRSGPRPKAGGEGTGSDTSARSSRD